MHTSSLILLLPSLALNSRIRDPSTFCLPEALKYGARDNCKLILDSFSPLSLLKLNLVIYNKNAKNWPFKMYYCFNNNINLKKQSILGVMHMTCAYTTLIRT